MLGLYAWVAIGLVSGRASNTEGAGSAGRTGAAVPIGAATVLIAATTSYAFGRGIHIASNSIHDAMGQGVPQVLAGLAYLWDEHVGHTLVDFARIAFVVGVTALESRATPRPPSGTRWITGRIFVAMGAVAYGFIYFATAVEGQTVPLALPFTAIYAVWGIRQSPRGPAAVRGFFTAASLISLLLFLIYGLWRGGFPEFTRSGML